MNIDFGDKIECLVAKREPVIVALYQPMLDLTVTDIGGPCYDSNRDDAVSKVGAFISHANELGAQLIILPEFATPIEILTNICNGTLRLSESTLLVLPLEALSLAEYGNLTDRIGTIASKLELGRLGTLHAGTKWVNACAVVAVTSEGVEVYVQPKRFASPPETSTLSCGTDYFIFTGRGIAMSVFVCADANDSGIYEDQIDETKMAKTGRYFVHTQWNLKPTYDLYDEFWRKIIANDPTQNILFSLNMAAQSEIKQGDQKDVISLPFTRVACSGDTKIDEKYMKPNTYTAFKSVFRNNWGTIYNLVYPYDSSHFLALRRPYEMVDDAVNQTKTFLISSQMFLSKNGSFVEYTKDDIASLFTKYLVNINDSFKEETIAQIKALSFEDIEMLIASFLQEKKYIWLKRDILERPFIWSTFFSPLGIISDTSRNSMDFFITTLKKIDQCDTFGYRIIPFEKINRYPINLISNSNDGYGWVFNCKGLSDVRISEDVAALLLKTDYIRKGSVITLFPTNYTDAFCANDFEKNIINTGIEIFDPVNNLSQDFDVTSPEARPRIRVNVL
jgi:hypothetical protein